MKPLSKKQEALLAFIRAYIAEHQFAPTFHEMLTACGFSSTSVVSYNLDKLEERGYLMRPYKLARTVTLTEQAS